MAGRAQIWCALLMCLASVAVGGRMIAQERGSACDSLDVKTVTYLSPPITAKPGEANSKFFPCEYPKGHIGIKGMNAEIVDHNGESVLLSHVYLHHWAATEFKVPKGNSRSHLHRLMQRMRKHHHKFGMHCDSSKLHATEEMTLMNFFGKGGETRKTDFKLPGVYVRESGKEVDGYEVQWILNVHGLDTRGVVSRMGCAECRCHLYNATTNPDGEPLPENYLGGQWCCDDGMRCALQEGFNGEEITFHLKYTFEYIDWNECLIPVHEVGTQITEDNALSKRLEEFTVMDCGDADPNSEECFDTREATFISPLGGEVVNTFSHLHASALNATLWGEDGRLICESTPMYDQGLEPGNEKGYLVGIRTCYGNAGTPDAVKVRQGERLKYVVVSSKVDGPHTRVMGLLKMNVATGGVSAAY